jgi:hypothetical protein
MKNHRTLGDAPNDENLPLEQVVVVDEPGREAVDRPLTELYEGRTCARMKGTRSIYAAREGRSDEGFAGGSCAGRTTGLRWKRPNRHLLCTAETAELHKGLTSAKTHPSAAAGE